MSTGTIVVLVAGIAIVSSLLARKRAYSHNQRIVLSGIAIGLLLLTFLREGNIGYAVAVAVVVIVLLYVLKSGKG